MLGALIDDLKTQGCSVKAKPLRAWEDIRNAAAHGIFHQFSRRDVENMIARVKTFLADYL